MAIKVEAILAASTSDLATVPVASVNRAPPTPSPPSEQIALTPAALT
jgi:hypothetical protein